MNKIRTGYMSTVREINEACSAACYGRGEIVMGEFADSQSRVTRARILKGVLQGRAMNGDWKEITDAKVWE